MSNPISFKDPERKSLTSMYLQTAITSTKLEIFQQNFVEAKNGLVLEYAPYGVKAIKGKFSFVVPYTNIKVINEN